MKKKIRKTKAAELLEEIEYMLWLLETFPTSRDWKIKIRNRVAFWREVATNNRSTKDLEAIRRAVQREYEGTCFELYRDGEIF